MLDRDTILKLASQGATYSHGNAVAFEDVDMVRFAHAIARMVYEDAASVCDRRVMGDNNREDEEAKCCAAAIRQRAGEKKE